MHLLLKSLKNMQSLEIIYTFLNLIFRDFVQTTNVTSKWSIRFAHIERQVSNDTSPTVFGPVTIR